MKVLIRPKKLKGIIDIEEVIRSIRIMSVMTPECDFVFTGGEPLANLEELGRMICAVHQKDTNHKVFINTTLPVNEKVNEEKLADFLNKMYKLGLITGILAFIFAFVGSASLIYFWSTEPIASSIFLFFIR